MFVGALVVLVFSLAGLGVWRHEMADLSIVGLVLAALLAGAFAGATFIALLNHPEAVRNWFQGSYVELKEEPRWMAWVDWSPLWTRSVAIDETRLRLKRSTLFGLVPVSVVDRPLSDFYRIALNVHSDGGQRHHHHHYGRYGTESDLLDLAADLTIGDPNLSGRSWWQTYRLALVDRHADEVTVLTVTDGISSDAGEQIVLPP
jgi:hypothetical protein